MWQNWVLKLFIENINLFRLLKKKKKKRITVIEIMYSNVIWATQQLLYLLYYGARKLPRILYQLSNAYVIKKLL